MGKLIPAEITAWPFSFLAIPSRIHKEHVLPIVLAASKGLDNRLSRQPPQFLRLHFVKRPAVHAPVADKRAGVDRLKAANTGRSNSESVRSAAWKARSGEIECRESQLIVTILSLLPIS